MKLFSLGKWYSIPTPPVETARADAYTQAALNFINGWLNGNQHFHFKTSGSTGKPKPITLSRPRLESSALGTLAALELASCKQFLVCLDVNFIAGAMMLVRAILGGKDIVLVKPSSNPLIGLPEDISPDFVALVPMQLQQMLDDADLLLMSKLAKFKAILLGGAPVSHELDHLVHFIDIPVFHSYGMTETVSHIALRRINGHEPEDFFKALPGISIETDGRGCLVINGSVTDNEVIITNDIVEMNGLNQFKWIGRADNVINSGGLKIQAETVEATLEKSLRELGHQRNLFVIGLPNVKLGQQVTAVIEGKHFDSKLIDLVKSKMLAEGLKKEEVPRQWLYARKFARTLTQKIDKIKTLGMVSL